MNSLRTYKLIFLVCILIICGSQSLFGQGTTIKNLARELVETISKKFGNNATRELTKLGGESAVKALLEKATQEGGATLVERVIFYGTNYGPNALKVISNSPKVLIGALDKLPPNLVNKALQATTREPEVVTRLVTQYGGKALEVAAKHPGVGTKLVTDFGKNGLTIADKISTEQAIKLIRMEKEIKIPGVSDKIFEIINKYGGAAIDHIDRHKVLYFVAVPAGYTLTASGIDFVENPDKWLKAAGEGVGKAARATVLGDNNNKPNTQSNMLMIGFLSIIFIVPILFYIYRKTFKAKDKSKEK